MHGKFIVGMMLVVLLLSACTATAKPTPTPWPETAAWETAVEILYGGHVEAVMQLHNLSVTFLMDDGSQVKTVEPAIDEIFREIDLCGRPCRGITLTTE